MRIKRNLDETEFNLIQISNNLYQHEGYQLYYSSAAVSDLFRTNKWKTI